MKPLVHFFLPHRWSTYRRWVQPASQSDTSLLGIAARELFLLGVLVCVALYATWPLAMHFRSALATSFNHAGTVPLLNAWTMWWNAESLSHGLRDYWNAPIFAPTPGAFAFSEPQPITMLFSPLVWLTSSPILACNIYLITSLVLNGWFAARLLRRLGCLLLVQLCVGVAMVLHPLALRNIEAVQLLSIWASLWTITALLDLVRAPTWRAAVWLGIAFAVQGAACLHQALFLAMILMVACWTVVSREEPLKFVKALVLAGVAAVCLLSPLVWPMHLVHNQHPLVRDPEVVASLSATWSSWRTMPDCGLGHAWLVMRGSQAVSSFPGPLLPGLLSTLLAGWGIVYWLVARRRVAQMQFSIAFRLLIAIGLVSLVFSFGPNLAWGAWSPWNELCVQLASLARVRSPYRFAYFTQVAILLLAGLGGEVFIRRGRNIAGSDRKNASLLGWTVCGIASLCLLGLGVECIPRQCRLVYPPHMDGAGTGWVNFVANHATRGPILCLPTAAGSSEAAHEISTRWMCYATVHEKPILNGYSGFIPRNWQDLNYELHRQGLTESTLQIIGSMGCELIVLRCGEGNFESQLDQFSRLHDQRVTRLFEDERFQVWRLSSMDWQ